MGTAEKAGTFDPAHDCGTVFSLHVAIRIEARPVVGPCAGPVVLMLLLAVLESALLTCGDLGGNTVERSGRKGGPPSGRIGGISTARLSLASTGRESEFVLDVVGEVDGYTGPDLETRLRAVIDGRHNADVTLDLKRMTFISSVGLTVIADAAGRIGRSGGRLSLRAPNHAALKLLKLAGLGALVVTPPSPDCVDERRPVTPSRPWV